MAIISTSKSSLAIMLPIFVFLISTFPLMSLSAPTLETFQVPSGGPESYVFDSMGSMYTGVNDGRIVKHEGPVLGFVNFAYASPQRTSDCDGTTDPEMGSICGRTLGLGFHYKTNQLYIADAYHGLCVVGLKGGLATQLLSSVDGLPLKWLDGLDVDQTTGKVYFTDVSTQYNLSQVADHISTGDSTGRLIEYDPETKKARVLLSGLKGAGGVGASKDGSFVLLSEFTGSRITKYWLTGPKADTAELLLDISGPANMKLTSAGEFWVALNVATPAGNVPTGMRMDANGKLLETLNFGGEPYNETYITEVHEYKGSIYIASIYVEFGAVYKKVSEEEKTLLGSVNLSEEFSSF